MFRTPSSTMSMARRLRPATLRALAPSSSSNPARIVREVVSASTFPKMTSFAAAAASNADDSSFSREVRRFLSRAEKLSAWRPVMRWKSTCIRFLVSAQLAESFFRLSMRAGMRLASSVAFSDSSCRMYPKNSEMSVLEIRFAAFSFSRTM